MVGTQFSCAVVDGVEEVLSLRGRCEAIGAEGPSSEWRLRKTTSWDKGDILETREESHLFLGSGAASTMSP